MPYAIPNVYTADATVTNLATTLNQNFDDVARKLSGQIINAELSRTNAVHCVVARRQSDNGNTGAVAFYRTIIPTSATLVRVDAWARTISGTLEITIQTGVDEALNAALVPLTGATPATTTSFAFTSVGGANFSVTYTLSGGGTFSDLIVAAWINTAHRDWT